MNKPTKEEQKVQPVSVDDGDLDEDSDEDSDKESDKDSDDDWNNDSDAPVIYDAAEEICIMCSGTGEAYLSDDVYWSCPDCQ
jgi:hypothetical protein